MTGHAVRTSVERPLSTLGQDLAQERFRFLYLLVGVLGFWSGDRDEPVEIGVSERANPRTARTCAARAAGRRLFTNQGLGHPKGQPLLPDARRADKQCRLREPAGGDPA